MFRRLLFVFAIALTSIAVFAQGPLTFQERVKAQEAIERVYYAHQLWPKENLLPKPPFEQAVPRTVIEAKVADYLKKCAALEKFWQKPIQPEQLHAEMERMAKRSRDKATLKELFDALKNNPGLIAECLARPVLADRLIHNWYAYDTRYHSETKAKAQAAQDAGPSAWAESKEGTYRQVVYELRADDNPAQEDTAEGCPRVTQLGRTDLDQWLRKAPKIGKALLQESPEALLLIHTASENQDRWEGETLTFEKRGFSAWWGDIKLDPSEAKPNTIPAHSYVLPEFGPSDECTIQGERWEAVLEWMPEGNREAASVWTGSRMIVWGGHNWANSSWGGQYDPPTDTWSPMSTTENCPTPRYWHTAVWTGSRMVVWGGEENGTAVNTGGQYDPTSNTWTSTSIGPNCPAPRERHTAIWTGNRMIVWGGYFYNGGYNYPISGGQYDPTEDTWTPTSTGANCPVGRDGLKAVWTGSRVIVWGGCHDGGYCNTGGLYDPVNDTWAATSTGANCPAPRNSHSAIWTGTKMIVWGGSESPPYLNTGGVYDPQLNAWSPTSTGSNCPSGRYGHTAVWTGSRMIVWGTDTIPDNTGGLYDPVDDTWAATSTGANCPENRSGSTSVWTGSEMIVWGGYDGVNTYFASGGRYDPVANLWTPVMIMGSPSARWLHSAVWTGTRMIVWGGYDVAGNDLNSGGQYDPATDTWTPTSIGSNCPSARDSHTSLWTGTKMIVWGGYDGSTFFNSGGQYDPVADTWTATSMAANCPAGRSEHTAVWTGSRMLVWGGQYLDENGGSHILNTGGQYDPANDTWTTTSTKLNCPTPRFWHTAVWTGTKMVVWGGLEGWCLNTGGQYDPALNTWASTSTSGSCPTGRYWHTAVWAGSQMIVWGGYGGGSFLNSGGLYDPVADSWLGTSTDQGCPSGRDFHTTVWTGSGMIVWGGYDSSVSGNTNTGSQYDPSLDTWTQTSTGANCPAPRNSHTAVWTGGAMIVWGGGLGDGGIYYPAGVPIEGPSVVCEGGSPITLFTSSFSSYQWTKDGTDLQGATAETLQTSLPGTYAVRAMDSGGCTGTSSPYVVSAGFCSTSEVSPAESGIPIRLEMNNGRTTGYYLYFEHLVGAMGYNIYEGNIGTYYSHGSAPGNVCNATVTDLGTGEMRAAITPSPGNHYYLVTAHNTAFEGPSGFKSTGEEIDPAQSTCAP